jgi:hypothetical protein
VNAGGSLAPGASVGTLTMNLGSGTLDVSAVSSGGLKFELNAPGTGDQVLLNSGTLNIGTLDFSDFSFTNLGGVAVGTYKLFDAASTITGSIGTASGTFGGFSATLSRDNINNDVLLNVTGTAGIAGDYNNNGKVDAADYVLWRKNPGAFGGNPAGYNTWRANFGNPPGSGSGLANAGSAVPEPSTLILMNLAAVAWNHRRRRRA